MPDFSAIEEKKIIRLIKEWMIDDYATTDIISQVMLKWLVDESQAHRLLNLAAKEWKENENENNEQKRLRKIESLKKLKRSLKETHKGTPAGIAVILNVEKELFRLESLGGIITPDISSQLDLTGKQEKFCREYVLDFNGTQAYRRAGYVAKTDDTAAVEAFKLLRKPKIAKYIELLQEEIRKKTNLTTDMIVQELRDLSEWNIQDFLNQDKSLKDLTSLPLKTTKPISAIKVTERILPDGTKQITTELKLTDKRAALVDLGRHTGAFEKDNKQKKPVLKMEVPKIIKATLKLS